ncbi:unnamed protein product, partial [Rotaria socialis]
PADQYENPKFLLLDTGSVINQFYYNPGRALRRLDMTVNGRIRRIYDRIRGIYDRIRAAF